MPEYPQLLHTVLDTTEPRLLAEFYQQLLGLRYREGDEPPVDGRADDADWLVLVDSRGVRKLAFQQVERLDRTTWPSHEVPMQLHLDFTVSSVTELHRQREIAESRARKFCSIGRTSPMSRSSCSRISQAIPSASSSL